MTTDPIRTVAIIQARMSSSRLPGKVLLDIAGQPMLAHVIERTRLAQTVSQVVVATTDDPADNPLVEFCARLGCPVYRGSQFDVLDRYFQAARQFQAQVIVRITADCPLLDPALVDLTVRYFLGEAGTSLPQPVSGTSSETEFPWDFAANRLPPPWGRTYPIGLDVEVCSFSALARAWQSATHPHQREHVMPYLYEYSPIADARHLESYTPPEATQAFDPQHPQFRTLLINHSQDFGSLRWTVDTPEDLALVRAIFEHFQPRRDFSWQEVLEYVRAHPELAQINAAVIHKKLHDVDSRTG